MLTHELRIGITCEVILLILQPIRAESVDNPDYPHTSRDKSKDIDQFVGVARDRWGPEEEAEVKKKSRGSRKGISMR